MATLKKRKGGQGRGGGKRMRSLKVDPLPFVHETDPLTLGYRQEPTGKLDWTASRDDDGKDVGALRVCS